VGDAYTVFFLKVKHGKKCFDELTSIYNLVNTQTGKKMAKRRHSETKVFLSALKRELSVADLAIS